MKEILDQLFTVYHLPLVVSLGVFLIFAAIGMLGIFDFDADIDADVEVEDVDVSGGGSIFNGLLKFLNASDIPLMLILAVLNTIMLVISLMLNRVINPDQTLWLGLVLYIPNFIVSAVLVHFVTKPFKAIFRELKDDEPSAPIVGRIGIVKSLTMDHKFGQVEVPQKNESPSLIHCVVGEGYRALKKGDKVIITSKIEGENKFVGISAKDLKVEPEGSYQHSEMEDSHQLQQSNNNNELQ